MKQVLKTRKFWRLFVLLSGATLLLFLLVIFSLKGFTRHGQAYQIPDLSGYTLDDLPENIRETFRFVIIDSIYDENSAPGTILRQNPSPANYTVKKGRTFYLTIVSSLPEDVRMPNLIDLSLRQAMSTLESYGLRLGNIIYQQDFSTNAVMQQSFQGQTIAAGTIIPRGSSIDIIVSGQPIIDDTLHGDAEFLSEENPYDHED